MLRNVLLGIILVIGVLMVVDAVRRAPQPPPPRSAPEVAPAPPEASRQQAAPAISVMAAVVSASATGTPALDMMARLAVRRRLAREGDHIYLDSLLAHTDSVLTRWAERTMLTVALIPDTTLAGWTPSLFDEVRMAMRAWDSNGSGPVFREVVSADSGDITVRWVAMLPDSGQVGTTSLDWRPDGVVHSAAITLALRRSPDGLPVPATARSRVAAHEFGHALGLPHSGDAGDIMFPTSPIGVPSLRDQATLRLLYAVMPGPLKVQP